MSFLDALWGQMPDGASIQLWEKDKKLTSYFPNAETARTYAAIAAKHGDVYMAAGLANGIKKPSRRRARANEVVGIAGLWADIDVVGGPEAKTDAAPAKSAAIELAYELLVPTLVVNSGYGVQAWWLLEEPWMFGTVAEREQAAALIMGFQGALRAAARAHGFGLDSTHDLARLMRLPGTQNFKDPAAPVDVTLIEDTETRHELEALHHVARGHIAQAGARASAEARGELDVQGIGDPPMERLIELMDIDQEFQAIWSRKAKRAATWSQSEYDGSISMRLVNAGFTDQEIVDAIAYHRRKGGVNVEKAERLPYLTQTVAGARAKVEVQEADEAFQARRDVAVTKLERAASQESAPASVTISLFNEVMGGPEIKEVIQDGTDPDTARFRVILADGREVPLGSVAAFTDQRRFGQAFLVVTQYHMPMVKAIKWHKVIQALVRAATIREEAEDARANRVKAWLEPYLESRLSTDRDGACRTADPFEAEDMIYVALEPFLAWLRKMRGERIAKADLQLLMEAAGFERRTVNYVKANGGKSTRSYYYGDREAAGL